MKLHPCVVASLAIMILPFAAKGESNMPTLNWMGREKATNAVKEVVMKILRADKALGYVSRVWCFGWQVGFTMMDAAQSRRIKDAAFSPS